MADYRDTDVNGVPVEPYDAFVSSSSTGIHKLNVLVLEDGEKVTHTMGEYRSREEAQSKVDAWHNTHMVEPEAAPSYNSRVGATLTPEEEEEYAKVKDAHDRVNFTGKYKQ